VIEDNPFQINELTEVFSREMSDRLTEECMVIAEKVASATEALTVEQIADALRQALQSGDFVRCVEQGEHPPAQSVSYVPYREKLWLRARVNELTTLLERYGKHRSFCGEGENHDGDCVCGWMKVEHEQGFVEDAE